MECDFIKMTDSKELEIPFWLKMNLTIPEASTYSNIGINRIRELVENPQCPFALSVGNKKKLIKRVLFEKYIEKANWI